MDEDCSNLIESILEKIESNKEYNVESSFIIQPITRFKKDYNTTNECFNVIENIIEKIENNEHNTNIECCGIIEHIINEIENNCTIDIISVNDIHSQTKNQVRFASNDSINFITKNDKRNDELHSIHGKEHDMNNKNIKEVQTIENGFFQSNLLTLNSCDNNNIDYMEYPSKHRDYIFDMLNSNGTNLPKKIGFSDIKNDDSSSKISRNIGLMKYFTNPERRSFNTTLNCTNIICNENKSSNELKSCKTYKTSKVINAIDKKNTKMSDSSINNLNEFKYFNNTAPINVKVKDLVALRANKKDYSTNNICITTMMSNFNKNVKHFQIKENISKNI